MSNYEPPNTESADTDLPVPAAEYAEPDVTSHDVEPHEAPPYVGPYVGDDSGGDPPKEPKPKAEAKAEPKAEPKGEPQK